MSVGVAYAVGADAAEQPPAVPAAAAAADRIGNNAGVGQFCRIDTARDATDEAPARPLPRPPAKLVLPGSPSADREAPSGTMRGTEGEKSTLRCPSSSSSVLSSCDSTPMEDLLGSTMSGRLGSQSVGETKNGAGLIRSESYNVERASRRMRRMSISTPRKRVLLARQRMMGKAAVLGGLQRNAAESRAIYGDERGLGLDVDSVGRPRNRWNRVQQHPRGRCENCCCCRGPVIEHNGHFRQGWDMCQVLLLLYVAIVVPLRIGFDDDMPIVPLSTIWWVELLIDVYFLVDISINFRTTFEARGIRGSIKSPPAIAAHYLRGWFLVDFVACFPVSYIEQVVSAATGVVGNESNTAADLKILKALRLFRLAKMLRLARFRRLIKVRYTAAHRVILPDAAIPPHLMLIRCCAQRWEEHIDAQIMSVIQMATLFVAVLFMAHVVACSWHLVGTAGHEAADGSGSGGSTIRTPAAPNSSPYNVAVSHANAPNMEWEESVGWVDRPVDGAPGSFREQSLWYKYLRTYYWGVGLTSGSARGDILPLHSYEFVFVILAEVVGTVALGLILGSLSSMFTTARLLEDRVERQLAELREFLEEKEVPPKLRNRIRHYMELLYRRRTGYDEKELLSKLTPPLAREMIDLLYRPKVRINSLLVFASDKIKKTAAA